MVTLEYTPMATPPGSETQLAPAHSGFILVISPSKASNISEHFISEESETVELHPRHRGLAYGEHSIIPDSSIVLADLG